MTSPAAPNLSPEEVLPPPELARLQRDKLAATLREVREHNPFYRRKLQGIDFDPHRDPLDVLPLTTRAELEQSQLECPPYGTNLTHPLDTYCRYHQTSGSGGRPLRWLDTAESWRWVGKCWETIFRAGGVVAGDRVLFPFSFGPFLGFWAAFDAAHALGMLALPAGGLTTSARLRMLLDNDATIVCCTPTYALRLAEVAAEERIDLARSAVRKLFVAGEPGGSVPAVRSRIESAWGARVFDHSGMTEIGPVAFECLPHPGGLHVNESEFIAEVISPPDTPTDTHPIPDISASAGAQYRTHSRTTGELVLTNLGRTASPLIRYRTGDQVTLVRPDRPCSCGRWYARLEGGILGRVDDMFIVRGNNVFPGAVEAVIRQFPEIAEFRLTVTEGGAAGATLTEVQLEIEPAPHAGPPATTTLAARVAAAVQQSLSFRADVLPVPPGSLPRFELKAKRFVRRRVQTG